LGIPWLLLTMLPLTAICLTVAVLVAVTMGGRRRSDAPRCGRCGYNLTGSTGNRCPECGRLFVEAGIITSNMGAPGRRRWLVIALVFAPIVLLMLGGGFAALRSYQSRYAALVAQRRAALSSRGSVSTRPSSRGAPAGRTRP